MIITKQTICFALLFIWMATIMSNYSIYFNEYMFIQEYQPANLTYMVHAGLRNKMVKENNYVLIN